MRVSLHRGLMRFGRFAFVGLFAAGALTACGGLRRGSDPAGEVDVVTVTVVNHHQLNVTLFNIAQGRRDRLGEVTAAASASFKLYLRGLPASEVQLLADPIGATQGVRSDLLRVAPGDTVRWVLESDLARSHIVIR